MSEFLAMGGYAGYVFGSYTIFFAALVIDLIAPPLRLRRLRRQLHLQQRRAAARAANTETAA